MLKEDRNLVLMAERSLLNPAGSEILNEVLKVFGVVDSYKPCAVEADEITQGRQYRLRHRRDPICPLTGHSDTPQCSQMAAAVHISHLRPSLDQATEPARGKQGPTQDSTRNGV